MRFLPPNRKLFEAPFTRLAVSNVRVYKIGKRLKRIESVEEKKIPDQRNEDVFGDVNETISHVLIFTLFASRYARLASVSGGDRGGSEAAVTYSVEPICRNHYSDTFTSIRHRTV